LVCELARREFSSRYKGSLGGVLWSFVQPLFILSVYTLAFGVIFKVRWGLEGDTKEFAFMLYAGLIVYNAFTECLTRAPLLIIANPNYVKKIVFPLEIMPWIPCILSLTHALIGWLVWMAGHLLLIGSLHFSCLYFPLILFIFLPILLGVGWLFSALGVVVRDMSHFTGLLSHALLFLTPIFFSFEAVPEQLRRLMLLNPLTFIVGQARQVLFTGHAPDFAGLGFYFAASLVFCACSLWVFRRLRPIFADLV